MRLYIYGIPHVRKSCKRLFIIWNVGLYPLFVIQICFCFILFLFFKKYFLGRQIKRSQKSALRLKLMPSTFAISLCL